MAGPDADNAAKLKANVWLIAGLAAIVAGYLLLAAGDITAAPLLLVGGYCVCIPIHLFRTFRRGPRGKGE